MKPERFDRRITLQRFTYTISPGSGEQLKTWDTLGPEYLKASRRRASSNETLASAEIAAAISDVFEIRYGSTWSDVNPKDRLVFEDRVYEIVGAEEIGRREGIRITAIARAEAVVVAEYVPMLDFSLTRNSQYLGQVV